MSEKPEPTLDQKLKAFEIAVAMFGTTYRPNLDDLKPDQLMQSADRHLLRCKEVARKILTVVDTI